MSESIFSGMRGGRRKRLRSEINVVPYIDVMLVLLVIFMVCAPIANLGNVDVPTAEKTSAPPDTFIQVSLRPDVSAEIGIHQPGKPDTGFQNVPDHDALMRQMQQLHAEHPDMPVLIAADKNIIYNEVIQVISDAKKMGIKRVGLATQ
ncbi:MAG: biopolymer transporter ExbD [Oxalobacter sp.]|jgi:biopolymer transport protein TolR|nr:biopolymer transporter ExbD [Oxalobacter sp.]